MGQTRVGERWTLSDGSVVIVRPLERDDRPLVQAVFNRMGEEARFPRFLGFKKQLSARDMETLTAVDHHEHKALVALDDVRANRDGAGGSPLR
jgi:hypothetical protein